MPLTLQPAVIAAAEVAPWIGVALAVVMLLLSLRANRRKRLIDNIPTCKTTGVFIGLVELKGTAEAETPLVSYLAETACVHYDWSVQEHWSRTVTEHYTDKDGKSRTRTRRESGWKTDLWQKRPRLPLIWWQLVISSMCAG